MTRKTGLGRGLGALIPDLSPAVQEVDVDLISPNPHQPRSHFDPTGLEELAQSIREHGVIQPLIVSRPSGPGGVYQLIAGERRLLASRQAGLRHVPVIVKEASPQALLELALVENLQRQDLGALEEAAAFRRLVDEFDMTQESVAERVGRSRSSIANSLRLLALPEDMQASLARGEMTPGHARALLSIEDVELRRRAWQRIVQVGMTVRDAEALAKTIAPAGPKAAGKARRADPDVRAVEEKLQSVLGTKVELAKGRKGGKMTIHFYSDEELDSLVDRLLDV